MVGLIHLNSWDTLPTQVNNKLSHKVKILAKDKLQLQKSAKHGDRVVNGTKELWRAIMKELALFVLVA